jgi:hypothetical protein
MFYVAYIFVDFFFFGGGGGGGGGTRDWTQDFMLEVCPQLFLL